MPWSSGRQHGPPQYRLLPSGFTPRHLAHFFPQIPLEKAPQKAIRTASGAKLWYYGQKEVPFKDLEHGDRVKVVFDIFGREALHLFSFRHESKVDESDS